MKNRLPLFIAFFAFASCANETPIDQNVNQVDSLRLEIAELNSKLDTLLSKNLPATNAQDMTGKAEEEALEIQKLIPEKRQENEKKEEPKKETETEKQKVQPKEKEKVQAHNLKETKGDTLFHYYSKGPVSVIRTPFINGHAKWIFYDLQGNPTCELKEIDLSFTVSVQLTFHENGAAKQAKIHDNPGASLHFYVSTVSFDTNNQPGWMTTEAYPPSLEDHMKPPFYWDKKTWGWRQQEIIREQDTPR